MMFAPSMLLSLLAITFTVEAAVGKQRTRTTTAPNWFQTTPNNYAGPTVTGAAPFLAQTNPAPFGQVAYVPNAPLQTSEPIVGAQERNIFHLMGNLSWTNPSSSPYFSPENGFGVDEYSLPEGANITQMHMFQRHGSRYPAAGENFPLWASGIFNATANGTVFEGDLSFLNDWSFKLGEEVLVPQGRKELFDSGILNYYNYGHLYNNSSKLVVRSASQDRVLKSAENFLAGFFGLDWAEHANLLVTIDPAVTGVFDCTRYYDGVLSAFEQVGTWNSIYLKERTAKLRKLTGSYNWTVADTFYAQKLCPYETVALGYSDFCQLFTYEEWEGLEYYFDIIESGAGGFLSPTGRAYGIAWVEEFLARVEGHLLNVPANTTGANMTLDMNPVTFPVNQSLYLEFGHDGDIVAAMTAFGLTQFAGFLPATGPPAHQQFFSSKIVPFAGRLNIEIIKAPHKVSARRSSKTSAKHDAYICDTGERHYVHFILNQRTIPLHVSFEACEYRDDGWCELTTFMNVQKESLAKAEYQYACFGNWTMKGYGTYSDGRPV
ncbi:histidine phosphatase superfamily [Lipomyces doorenjongii]